MNVTRQNLSRMVLPSVNPRVVMTVVDSGMREPPTARQTGDSLFSECSAARARSEPVASAEAYGSVRSRMPPLYYVIMLWPAAAYAPLRDACAAR